MAQQRKLASASKRRWSARCWWVGMHVYVYAVLAYSGSLSPSALSTGWFVFAIAVAVVNVSSYVILQTSSPGYVENSEQQQVDLEAGSGVEESEHVSDSDSLVPSHDHGERSKSEDANGSGLHFCELCQLTQPLRSKHCKDCEKCVRQYDHHCDCAGTCVGEQNRRKFVVYLFVQAVEGLVMISVAANAFTLQDNVDEWFRANWLYLIAWFSVFCVLLIAIPLFIYQAFLISTNQTSWEHARRSTITYLRSLPDDHSPFDRGCFTNWRVFFCGGDTNKWVSSASKAPTRVASAARGPRPPLSPNDTSLM